MTCAAGPAEPRGQHVQGRQGVPGLLFRAHSRQRLHHAGESSPQKFQVSEILSFWPRASLHPMLVHMRRLSHCMYRYFELAKLPPATVCKSCTCVPSEGTFQRNYRTFSEVILKAAPHALLQYERASIGPTGAIAAGSGVCKGPYDALNGSALAWCAFDQLKRSKILCTQTGV